MNATAALPTANVIVCIKWSPGRPSDDATADERFSAMSPADQAALELGLRTSEATGDDLVVVTVGPTSADKILREALACGANRAIRIDAPVESRTHQTAAAAARVIGNLQTIRLVWCGDYSSDRGSGSFPAFLAAELGLEQSLGLIRVDMPTNGSFPFEIVRRLDGGRREVSRVVSTAVLSVEGSLVRLRRASLSRTLAAQSQQIEVFASGLQPVESPVEKPYRPRARSISSPRGTSPLDRIRSVTESSSPKGSSDSVHLEPSEAARFILDRLREWGYTQ